MKEQAKITVGANNRTTQRKNRRVRFGGKKDFEKFPRVLGNLEIHAYAQGRMQAHERPEKTISFHLQLIFRLTKGRK